MWALHRVPNAFSAARPLVLVRRCWSAAHHSKQCHKPCVCHTIGAQGVSSPWYCQIVRQSLRLHCDALAASFLPSLPHGFLLPPACYLQQVARESGVDIAALAGRGSGPAGRILRGDLDAFLAGGGAAQARAVGPAVTQAAPQQSYAPVAQAPAVTSAPAAAGLGQVDFAVLLPAVFTGVRVPCCSCSTRWWRVPRCSSHRPASLNCPAPGAVQTDRAALHAHR